MSAHTSGSQSKHCGKYLRESIFDTFEPLLLFAYCTAAGVISQEPDCTKAAASAMIVDCLLVLLASTEADVLDVKHTDKITGITHCVYLAV